MCFRVGFSGCSESNSTFDRYYFFIYFRVHVLIVVNRTANLKDFMQNVKKKTNQLKI